MPLSLPLFWNIGNSQFIAHLDYGFGKNGILGKIIWTIIRDWDNQSENSFKKDTNYFTFKSKNNLEKETNYLKLRHVCFCV